MALYQFSLLTEFPLTMPERQNIQTGLPCRTAKTPKRKEENTIKAA